MVIFYLVCTVFITVISGTNYYEESTVVLSPVELIDEVLEERRKTQEQGRQTRSVVTLSQVTTESATTEPNDEETSLKRRKVWSRWGKWGKCSVTCGGGAMTRRRVCTSGRCAPGELEVQWQPCSRASCALHADSRDTD